MMPARSPRDIFNANAHILIVDDEPANVLLLQRILRGAATRGFRAPATEMQPSK